MFELPRVGVGRWRTKIVCEQYVRLALGLFLLFINAAMLNLAAWFVDGFYVEGVLTSLMGAIIITVVGWAGSAFVGETGRVQRVDVEIASRRRG